MAVKVILLPGQIVVALAAMVTVAATGLPVLIVMILLVAEGCDKQVAELVMITFTWSLLFNADVVNTALLVPALMPFTCH